MIGDESTVWRSPSLADQHRPGADVLAALRLGPQVLRRIGQRHELAVLDMEHGVRRAEGLPQRLLTRRHPRTGSSSRSCTVTRCRSCAIGSDPDRHGPAQLPPAAHEGARARAVRIVTSSSSLAPAGMSIGDLTRAPSIAISRSVASSQATCCSAVHDQLLDRLAPAASTSVALHHVQEPHPHLERGSPRRHARGIASASPRGRPDGRRCAAPGRRRRRSSGAGSSCADAGTATARSPRRAPRRRSSSPRPSASDPPRPLHGRAASRASSPSSGARAGRGRRQAVEGVAIQPQPGAARESSGPSSRRQTLDGQPVLGLAVPADHAGLEQPRSRPV